MANSESWRPGSTPWLRERFINSHHERHHPSSFTALGPSHFFPHDSSATLSSTSKSIASGIKATEKHHQHYEPQPSSHLQNIAHQTPSAEQPSVELGCSLVLLSAIHPHESQRRIRLGVLTELQQERKSKSQIDRWLDTHVLCMYICMYYRQQQRP